MPALPSVPSTVQVKLHFTFGGDSNVESRFYLAYSGATPTATALETMATSLNTYLSTSINGMMQGFVTYTGCTWTDLASSTGAVATASASTIGVRSGGELAPGTAALVNLPVSRRYRGGKPRAYLPFGTGTDLTSAGLWASSFVGQLATFWNGMIAHCVATSSGGTSITSEVNVSYYEGFTNVPYGSPTKYRRTPTLRATPLVDVMASGNAQGSPKVASQRRRNKKA